MPASGDNRRAVKSNFDAEEWSPYEKILAHDYMHHAEIIAMAARLLGAIETPLILELGCGDAGVVIKALQGRPAAYTGIDSSLDSLIAAKQNLTEAAVPHKLLQADLTDGFTDVAGPFDIAFANYVLHHFQPRATASILAAVSQRLNPGGHFYFCDAVAREGEDREVWIARLLDFCEKEWTAIPPREFAPLADHVRENDYPLPASKITELVEGAGLTIETPVTRLGTSELFGYLIARK